MAPHLRSLPDNATLADLRGQYGDLFDLMRPYAERLMRGPSPFSPAQRELIAAYVSGVNSCQYCHGTHALVAVGFGIEEGTFASLIKDIDRAPIETRLKPVLKYVRKLTETPSRMTPQDAEAVYAAGWNDEALVHAIAVCAYFNNMNRLVEGAGIVGTASGYEQAAERLVKEGYARPGSPRQTPEIGGNQ